MIVVLVGLVVVCLLILNAKIIVEREKNDRDK